VNASRQINKIDEIHSFSSRFEQQGKAATGGFQGCSRFHQNVPWSDLIIGMPQGQSRYISIHIGIIATDTREKAS
jgi:hypothetical protein